MRFLMLILCLTALGAPRQQVFLNQVLFENPTCGGILIDTDRILTLSSCLGENIRLRWPEGLEVDGHLIDPGERVALVFLKKRVLLNLEETILNYPDVELKLGMKVILTNTEKSSSNQIALVEQDMIKTYYGLRPVLAGAPMWLQTDHLAKPIVIGMMIGETRALRLEPYAEFMLTPKPMYAIPAEVVSDRGSIFTIKAEVAPDHAPNQAPVLQTPAQPKAPESLGCICSQIRR